MEIVFRVLYGVLADEVTEFHHKCVSDAVIDRVSLAAPAYEARLVQHLQMLGYIGLVAIQLEY